MTNDTNAVESSLTKFLETGKDWDVAKTKEPGVFFRKMKGTKNKEASLAVNINPVDASGATTQRNGLNIRSVDQLKEFIRLLSLPETKLKVELLDKVNPDVAVAAGTDIIDM